MKKFDPETLLAKDLDLNTIENLPNDYVNDKVVLGIDIYRYSQYPASQQIYIPVIFEHLYQLTAENLLQLEPFLFDSYAENSEDYQTKFISTGDGGYQIFDNPIQAIIFALYFQMNVKRYCSGGSTDPIAKNLNKIVESIDLRFAITSEKVYSYQSNYFGPAIINNARILSKDNLNRLLIDINSVHWLTKNINALENLLDIDKEEFTWTNFFKDYCPNKKSFLFDEKGKIKAVDVQKVGAITSKTLKISVYNLHIQAIMKLDIDHHEYKTYVIALGNLNSSGINN